MSEKSQKQTGKILTGSEGWNENMYRLANDTTFARNADGCPMIIAGDHAESKVCIPQNLDRRGSTRFDFILENDQT